MNYSFSREHMKLLYTESDPLAYLSKHFQCLLGLAVVLHDRSGFVFQITFQLKIFIWLGDAVDWTWKYLQDEHVDYHWNTALPQMLVYAR